MACPPNCPRGFTPDRRRAVETVVHSRGGRNIEPGARARLIDTLARSTVPIEHLHTVSRWNANDESLVGQARGRSWAQAGRQTKIHLAPGFEGGVTPIHELGHAVSHAGDVPRPSTPGQRGAEEGFADRYVQMHAREPGYKSRVPRHATNQDVSGRVKAWNTNYGIEGSVQGKQFGEAYTNERKKMWG